MKTHSQKFLQQRRFYMVLPLLALPFITMIFWALGGGQGTPVKAAELKSGLNLNLPGAHFEKEEALWDKFTLYEQAKRDSLKYEEARRNDPYYVVSMMKTKHAADSVLDRSSRLNTSLGEMDRYSKISHQEDLINSKIEQLTQQINNPPDKQYSSEPLKKEKTQQPTGQSTVSGDDITRLERMMEMMSSPQAGDPEMQQIEGVLEKIMDVQHPERVAEKIRAQSLQHKQNVFPVELAMAGDNISLVEGQNERTAPLDSSIVLHDEYPAIGGNGFYGLDDAVSPSDAGNAIEAVVHDTQTVVAGSTIKMRLLSDIFVNGQLLSKDRFVYGTCAIAGERLIITITSLRDDNSILPVAMKAFDLDGLEGIYIPGAITRDAAKQASAQSVQDFQLSAMDNSLGIQAVSAGIEATKGLFSKKAKLIKITLKAGYQILLKDSNPTKS